ncbi:carbohydrate-binding module family 50 [Pyrrhoderma noxium]|uniref:Carbohydrate-binding module family 50 n=1 Tax=Pyrrhoderma noxium TaxID=2282107 RepID=A0A286UF68_9AGAM|nr:carbohydrate-binding module family 50 [Pyrrhoderma noxium]
MFSKVIVSAALLLSFLWSSYAIPAAPGPCTRNYTIRNNETCDEISSNNNVSTFQLTYANPSLNCTVLIPGKSICLGTQGADCTTTTVVKSDQGCNDIASAANIQPDTLAKNNPNINSDCTNIYPGEVLCTDSNIIGYNTSSIFQVKPHTTMFSKLIFSGAIIFSLISASFAAPSQGSCARTYTVQAGDFCDLISEENNVSTFQLTNANPGLNCNLLKVGQSLCLGLEGQDCQTVSVVESEQTCNQIASTAGIDVATLAANNPNINSGCTNIYPGEVLCTDSTIIGYSS